MLAHWKHYTKWNKTLTNFINYTWVDLLFHGNMAAVKKVYFCFILCKKNKNTLNLHWFSFCSEMMLNISLSSSPHSGPSEGKERKEEEAALET